MRLRRSAAGPRPYDEGAPLRTGAPHAMPGPRGLGHRPSAAGPPGYFARSKSIALYARSLLSRCSESIRRTVPDLERITIESVVADSER